MRKPASVTGTVGVGDTCVQKYSFIYLSIYLFIRDMGVWGGCLYKDSTSTSGSEIQGQLLQPSCRRLQQGLPPARRVAGAYDSSCL